jgi:hypothetical protein
MPLTGNGAPTSGTRGTGYDKGLAIGALYVDVTAAQLYVLTAITPATGLAGPGSTTSTHVDVAITTSVTWTHAT